jgi:hypothetical protein
MRKIVLLSVLMAIDGCTARPYQVITMSSRDGVTTSSDTVSGIHASTLVIARGGVTSTLRVASVSNGRQINIAFTADDGTAAVVDPACMLRNKATGECLPARPEYFQNLKRTTPEWKTDKALFGSSAKLDRRNWSGGPVKMDFAFEPLQDGRRLAAEYTFFLDLTAADLKSKPVYELPPLTVNGVQTAASEIVLSVDSGVNMVPVMY